MKELPAKVHRTGGNHRIAIDRTRDISKYAAKAVECLVAVQNEDAGGSLRGGNLRQADEYLCAVIRFAECARDQLRIDHCSD